MIVVEFTELKDVVHSIVSATISVRKGFKSMLMLHAYDGVSRFIQRRFEVDVEDLKFSYDPNISDLEKKALLNAASDIERLVNQVESNTLTEDVTQGKSGIIKDINHLLLNDDKVIPFPKVVGFDSYRIHLTIRLENGEGKFLQLLGFAQKGKEQKILFNENLYLKTSIQIGVVE
jgi:hypothetical protein